MRRRVPAVLLLSLILAACADEPPPALSPVAYDAIPGWTSDATDLAFAQFRRQCTRLAALRPDEKLGGVGEAATTAGSAGDYRAACLAAASRAATDAAAARTFFETWFSPVDAGALHLGGTFEGEFDGSPIRGGRFQVPVYARPPDLLTTRAPDGRVVSGRALGGIIVPYASRAEIDHGALAGRGLELLWLADPVDLFFLQLEGAGRVRLPDGRLVHLGYAGRNGQTVVPVGRVLVDHGLLDAADERPASIRAALTRQPALLDADPNYVFFRVLPALGPDEGAPGTLGVPLAALRSLAVDRSALPLGLPIFYETDDPSTGAPFAHLGFAEDTGGDLAGAASADIFFGWGEKAAHDAGDLHAAGHAVLLLPRPVVAAPSPQPGS